MSKNAHKIFEEYLSNHEGRYTLQKKAIVEEIFKIKSHFEIEDFINKMRAEKHPFSRATVYRTVKQLLEAGLLQKIATKDGKVYYEYIRSQKQHDHLICNVCGKIFQLIDPTIDSVLETLLSKLDFHPEYRSLHIYGQCSKCQKKHAK